VSDLKDYSSSLAVVLFWRPNIVLLCGWCTDSRVLSVSDITYVHRWTQVRLDALQLLCEHHKTTAALCASHLRLVQFFIRFNMDCQSSGFRQVLVAQLRKVCRSVHIFALHRAIFAFLLICNFHYLCFNCYF